MLDEPGNMADHINLNPSPAESDIQIHDGMDENVHKFSDPKYLYNGYNRLAIFDRSSVSSVVDIFGQSRVLLLKLLCAFFAKKSSATVPTRSAILWTCPRLS